MPRAIDPDDMADSTDAATRSPTAIAPEPQAFAVAATPMTVADQCGVANGTESDRATETGEPEARSSADG